MGVIHRTRAKRVEVDGIRFASKKEAARYQQLKLLEKAGDITHLEVHPKFKIVINGSPLRYPRTPKGKRGREVIAEMDFAYFQGQQRVVEDTKGIDETVSRLKRALVQHIYGVEVRVL